MTDRTVTRRIQDPFTGREVTLGDDLLNRLRGRYAVGPLMADGEPEMGWRQHQQVPIQMDAADRIEQLEGALAALGSLLMRAEMPTIDDPVDGKPGSDLVLRLPTEADALALQRMLCAVSIGEGASLGPDPEPRGKLLGWDTEGTGR